ncbi:hypothetical protein D3C78_1105340 [compost metagenome]
MRSAVSCTMMALSRESAWIAGAIRRIPVAGPPAIFAPVAAPVWTPVALAVPLAEAMGPLGSPELWGSKDRPTVLLALAMPGRPEPGATEEISALFTPEPPDWPPMRLRSTWARPGVVIWRSR